VAEDSWRHLLAVNFALSRAEEILDAVRRIEDPLERLVVARDVFAILRDTTETLGPQGLRGAAAVEAVALHGSAQAAADASADAGVTRSVIVRLVERHTDTVWAKPKES
jgi:hypothetical protein